jgi:hypothetical protein
MSRQIRVLLTSTDIRKIEAKVREIGDFRTVSSRSQSPRPGLLLSAVPTGQPGEPLMVFLCRPEDLDVLQLVEVPAQGHWAVESTSSPAIEFLRPYVGEGIIRAGRLYAKLEYYRDDQLVTKPDPFRRWVDDVFKAVKKTCTRDAALDAYVGAEARELAAKGEARFVTM